MNNSEEKILEIMNEALKLKDEGKTVPEILGAYPEYANELEEMFSVIGFLSGEKEKIAVPRGVLEKMVTNDKTERYLERGAKPFNYIQGKGKGRPSETLSQITDRMTNKWKIFVPVGVVTVLAIAVAIYSQLGTEAPQYATEEKAAGEQPAAVAVVPATGNVDDAINALLQEASADQSAFSQEGDDAALLLADSQAIGDFGGSYNELGL